MKRILLILALAGLTSSIYAENTRIIRTFYNDADKKARLTIWYQRYNNAAKNIRTQDRLRTVVTYIKPNELKRIVIPTKSYDDLALQTVMVSNTKRRSHWAALPYKPLQNAQAFTILYDEKNCFKITPSSRR